MLLFWIFIVNGIVRFVKKMGAGSKEANNKPKPQNNSQPTQTFQDIFKEIKKKVEDAQAKQNVPPYATFEEVKNKKAELKNAENKNAENKKAENKKIEDEKSRHEENQRKGVYRHKHAINEKEEKSAVKFDEFVKQERKKEHDITQREYKQAYEIKDEEDYIDLPFELDLRNALIGAMILERPYS